MSHMFPKYGYNPVAGEWNDSLKGTFLWSNANVSEAVPDVMTPSTWSLWWIFHYEANPIEFPGDYRFCGNICGRSYNNLSLLVSIFHAVGRDVRKELQGDLIGSVPADLDIPLIQFSAASVLWTALPRMLKARQYTLWSRQKIDKFLVEMPDWCRHSRLAIQGCRNPQDLLSLWLGSLKPAVVRACWMLRSVTMALGDPATKLHLDLVERVGESDANAMLSNFSGAGAGLESLGPLVGQAQVKNGRMTRVAYLERYGHRGPHEMELYAPGAEEDPDWFEKRMAEYSGSAVGVETLLTRQRLESDAAWRRYALRFPGKASATQKALEKVAGAAQQREQVRSEVTRMDFNSNPARFWSR